MVNWQRDKTSQINRNNSYYMIFSWWIIYILQQEVRRTNSVTNSLPNYLFNSLISQRWADRQPTFCWFGAVSWTHSQEGKTQAAVYRSCCCKFIWTGGLNHLQTVWGSGFCREINYRVESFQTIAKLSRSGLPPDYAEKSLKTQELHVRRCRPHWAC